MSFLSVRGFLDYAGPAFHSRLTWVPCCLPPTRNGVGILIFGLFAAQWPRPPMPLSTLQETPHDVPCKTRGQDGFATSFPVGLLHPYNMPVYPGALRIARDSRNAPPVVDILPAGFLQIGFSSSEATLRQLTASMRGLSSWQIRPELCPKRA